MTYNHFPVTFRYRALFSDGSIRYYIDMADLRREVKVSDLSHISNFEKYYNNIGRVFTYIHFNFKETQQ